MNSMPLSTTYNPASVMLKGGSSSPYLQTINPVSGPASGRLPSPPSAPPLQPTPPFPGGLGATGITATGSGPYDQAYRQNLAVYAGGQLQNPGQLSFNPTDNNLNWGQPTGGGNAPLFGMPSTLLGGAIGGNPFAYNPPTPAPTTDAQFGGVFANAQGDMNGGGGKQDNQSPMY